MLIRRPPELYRPPDGLLARDYLRNERGLYLPTKTRRGLYRAAFGIPTKIDSSATIVGAKGLSSALTIGVGTLIIIFGSAKTTNASAPNVTDNVAGSTNVYHSYAVRESTVQQNYAAWCVVTTAFAADKFSITWGPTLTSSIIDCFTLTGYQVGNVEDTGVAASNTYAVTTTPSLNSRAAAQAGDILMRMTSALTNATGYTEDAAWTNLANQDGSTTGGLSVAYKQNAGTAAVNSAPVFALSTSGAQMVMGFTGAPASSIGARSIQSGRGGMQVFGCGQN